ncbi:MAG: hypothetical protein WCL51_14445 [Bacteroidota bacterium]
MKNIILFLLILFFYSNITFAQLTLVDSLCFNQRYDQLKENDCRELPQGVTRNRDIDLSVVNMISPNAVDSFFINQLLKNKILIINEAHTFPQNRVLNHYLLNKLLQADTNYYVFFEALDNDISDSELTNIGGHGFYFHEPQMAENLRLVLKYSKKAFCYESTNDELQYDIFNSLGLNKIVDEPLYETFDDRSNFVCRMNVRDMNQYINFYFKYKDIIASNKNAKFIIMCGYGHVSEEKGAGIGNRWYTLAYILKKNLGIDPTTVDVTTYIDKCSNEVNIYYDKLTSKLSSDSSFYFIKRADFNTKQLEKLNFEQTTDYYIISPKTKLVNGRENWLRFDGKKYVKIDMKYFKLLTKKHNVFKAYYKKEDIYTTTPADIVYIDNTIKESYFVLYPGEYDIYINNSKKKAFTIDVK